MLVQYPLKICGEIRLPIHHCLLSNEADFSTITRIYTHPQSLAQCRKWLDERLPDAERIAVSSNAEGARIAATEKNAAALAGEVAILHYDISVLERNIEDESENTTRFLVLGKRDVPATGNDKTTLLLSTENKPGALTELLLPLTENKISMTRIESRPSRKSNWDYVFFIDIAGHSSDANVKVALETISQRAALFRIIGSYPRSI
jgi:chorismate mutase/prephenate dehydratase